MIDVSVTKDNEGNIKEFTAKSHSSSDVCAAVSMLAINTVNSIEAFTDDDFDCLVDEEAGGYLRFCLKAKAPSPSAGVLLRALELGLVTTKKRYPNEINLKGCDMNA